MTRNRVEQFLRRFVQWASAQSDIVAVALVGSYARGTPTATSDVDLVILTPRADSYLQNREWMNTFGAVENVQIEPYGRLTSVRAHYDDGLEIEYGLTDEEWAAEPLGEGTREVIENGLRVLLDRKSLFSRHPLILRDRPTSN